MLLAVMAAPAQAHTRADLDQWRYDWAQQADYALSGPLLAEWREMAARHPWYFLPRVTLPTAAYRHRGMGTNAAQWQPLVATYFAAELVPAAMCVLDAESGGNPTAQHPGSKASGLFQHLPKYWADRSAKAGWPGADIFDPAANVAVAAWLQRTGGWGHWTTWPLCR